jgi:hypothetical protein
LHRVAASVTRRIAPQWGQVLFFLPGGSGAWPGMGQYLYRHEPAFRAAVDEASSVVEEVLGWSPAPSFRGGGDAPAATPELARRDEIVRLGVMQIGQVDLWREQGIEAGGVLGLSLGEMVAPYAAGALSRADCARVIAAVSHAISLTRTPERMFVLKATAAEAARLCRTAPARLDYLGGSAPGTAVVLSREADADAIRAFLGGFVERERPTEWSYHTPRLHVDRAWLAEQLRGITTLAARCPVYSSAAGGEIPPGSPFDARFFGWMVSRSFHLNQAVSAALDRGFDTVVQLGAQHGAHAGIEAAATARGGRVRFINSMHPEREADSWAHARRQARGLRAMPRPAPAPVSARTVDFADPSVRADLFGVYRALRAQGSVHFIVRDGSWLVLHHADVLGALARHGSFSSALEVMRDADPVLLGSDPPEHTAARRLVSRHFTAAALEHRVELGERTAAGLLQPLLEGREVEVVHGFAIPFAHAIGADVLGMDPRAAVALVEPRHAAEGNTQRLFTELREPLDAVAGETAVYRALREEGLGDEAARSLVRLLWIAGTDTLARVLPSAVLLLVRHDEVRARIAAEPALAERFADEVFRLSPPEHTIVRVANEEVKLGGATIPAGAVVRLSLAAANRDPARFADPDAIRLDRPPGAHLAFGGGVHRCIGAALARAQTAVAVRTLLRLAPGFRALQPLSTVRHTAAGIQQLVIER